MDKFTILSTHKLVDYIKNISHLKLVNPQDCVYKNHIGALFTDVILQAGINYNSVVIPKALNIYQNYPDANTTIGFASVIKENGIEKILNWQGTRKLKRMSDLIDFCLINDINYSHQLISFLSECDNQKSFLGINGIGNKTLHHLQKLLGVDVIAVDRHIFSYVREAGIESKDYQYVKMVVEYAADLMNISRRTIDFSIWSHMSTKSYNK